jgi:hypothetical protein
MLTLAFALVTSLAAHAASTPLATTQVSIPGPHGDAVLQATVADMKSVFQRFQPGLDSSSQIVKPLRVSGTADHPVVQVSIRKCVLVACETVDLEGDATLREVNGPCARNYQLTVDLSRSSRLLSGTYDRLDVTACYRTGGNADSGTLLLEASAHQAAGYSAGLFQRQVLGMLQLQVAPITTALDQVVKAKSRSGAK